MAGRGGGHSRQGPSRGALRILGDVSMDPGHPSSLTLGEDTLTNTMMGASEVLAS